MKNRIALPGTFVTLLFLLPLGLFSQNLSTSPFVVSVEGGSGVLVQSYMENPLGWAGEYLNLQARAGLNLGPVTPEMGVYLGAADQGWTGTLVQYRATTRFGIYPGIRYKLLVYEGIPLSLRWGIFTETILYSREKAYTLGAGTGAELRLSLGTILPKQNLSLALPLSWTYRLDGTKVLSLGLNLGLESTGL